MGHTQHGLQLEKPFSKKSFILGSVPCRKHNGGHHGNLLSNKYLEWDVSNKFKFIDKNYESLWVSWLKIIDKY